MQHMLKRTLSHTQVKKLKVNIVHVGVAELLFISLLTSVCVCIGLVCELMCAVNNEYTEFYPC